MIILWDEKFRAAVLREINQASKKILIASFVCDYRKTKKVRHIDAIIEALVRAQKRGVKIRIILNRGERDGNLHNTNLTAMRAMEHREIYAGWSKKGRRWHGKIIIIDGRLSIIGSHNLSEASLCRNGEISVLIEGEETGAYAEEKFYEI